MTAVWLSWANRQKRPQLCRLTSDRAKLINDRLRLGYEPEDLMTLVRYAYESDEPGARFWRGENDRGEQYLGLDNLFRITKLGDRVARALTWAAELEEGHVAGVVIPMEGGGRAGAFRSARRMC